MDRRILTLEKSFFEIKFISDRRYLEKTLHKSFFECGSSGSLYDRKSVIDALMECKENRDIDIYNYVCRQIDSNSWLVHYITKTQNDKRYFRTSVWVCENSELKLCFHQSSRLYDEIELIKY